MDSYLLEIIKRTTEYIEDNLLEALSLDSISDNVNLSKFHLLRIWKGATSTGLMEYVRRRRIAVSLGDLMNNRNSIDFISSKYSFGCERTYNRTFKDEYNTTPARWRRNPFPLNILDRFNADFMSSAGDGLMFFRSITVLPAFSIAGMEYKLDFREVEDNRITAEYATDFFYSKRSEVINPVEKDIYIGFTAFPDHKHRIAYYQPSVKISTNSIIAPYMKIRHIKPHKYGVFTYMGLHRPEEISLKKLEALLNYVSSIWMPTIEFSLSESFRFETVDYSRCNKQYCECDIYFPIAAL